LVRGAAREAYGTVGDGAGAGTAPLSGRRLV
jgi:hypothetical protein